MGDKKSGMYKHLLEQRQEMAERIRAEGAGETEQIEGWPYPYTKEEEEALLHPKEE